MTPAFVLLCVYQGTTFTKTVTLLDDENLPYDLSGWSARMQVREYRDAPVLLELTSANGRIVVGADGVITLNLTAATTEALPIAYDYEQWVYDLELFRVVGGVEEVMRPIFGVVVAYPEVTRV